MASRLAIGLYDGLRRWERPGGYCGHNGGNTNGSGAERQGSLLARLGRAPHGAGFTLLPYETGSSEGGPFHPSGALPQGPAGIPHRTWKGGEQTRARPHHPATRPAARTAPRPATLPTAPPARHATA